MKTAKFNKLLLALIVGLSSTFISSCGSDDPVIIPVVNEKFSNLHAQMTTDYTTNPPTVSGDYIKFSFSEGTTVTNDKWDIAFRGTTIIFNGGSTTVTDQPSRTGNAGAYIATGTLASVTSVDDASIKQDNGGELAITSGSGNGWYNYAGPPTHLISPIAGKVIVVRTHDNRYAKLEILSYYKDAPVNPDGSNSQYYTFNYVYQPNEGRTTFD